MFADGAVGAVTPAALDYLLGASLDPSALPPTSGWAQVPEHNRRMFRVRAIGQPRRPEPKAIPGEDRFRHPTESLLVGLSTYAIPVAFEVLGTPAGVEIRIGTWAQGEPRQSPLDGNVAVLGSLLRGLYPFVELIEGPGPPADPRLAFGGIVLGQPAPSRRDETDAAVAWDRVLRAMRGTTYRVLILSQPVADADTARLRNHVIEEMRATAVAEGPMSATLAPLAKYYTSLLERMLKDLTEARSAGAWRTGIYLLGDADSYFRLASTWRATFGGDPDATLPIQVVDVVETAQLAAGWSLPYAPAPEGPGAYQHPFSGQSLLTSARLSNCLHLPRLETAGFKVRLVPQFASQRGSPSAERRIALGGVLENRNPGTGIYEIDADVLTRHVLIAGLTGSGKTNTLFHLLSQADALGVPFLVIEPAKTEYRALLSTTLGARMRVYTLGDERVSPFRLNPFELLPGVTPIEHLDLLRAVFASAFGMWAPLPQVLERCLTEIYLDKGWDLATGRNVRQVASEPVPAPRLSDLVAKAIEIIPQLDYSDESTKEIRAALVTRLDSLRTGAKGRMLDVERSIPMDHLLSRSTVLELEGIGDDDDKAFVMGLILVRLWEHRRREQPSKALRHLLVVEEAHRLLSGSGKQATEREGDPKGKLVEAFSQMLSEIRSYGQGIVIADQVPVRLAPDVIKNTNLKIAHRLVSDDDRKAMAGAMAMDEHQSQALVTLVPGEAAVFSQGDDTATLVVVPPSKDRPSDEPTSREALAEASDRWRDEDGWGDLRFTRATCPVTCGTVEVCAAAEKVGTDAAVLQVVARLIDTMLVSGEALDRQWPDIEAIVRSRAPESIGMVLLGPALAHAGHAYAHRRGAQSGWAYGATDEVSHALMAVLLAKASGAKTEAPLAVLQALATRQLRRTGDPFPACSEICPGVPPLCRYRHAVADSMTRDDRIAVWVSIGDGDRWSQARVIADDVIDIDAPEAEQAVMSTLVEAHSAATGCAAQQLLFRESKGRTGLLLTRLQELREMATE
jgi:DNA helicase HerA-like ATPase